MSQAPRRQRVARVAEVVRTTRLTPHLVRGILGGEGLAGLPVGEFSDHYVKLLFRPADAPHDVPFDVEQVRGAAAGGLAGHPHVHGACMGRRGR